MPCKVQHSEQLCSQCAGMQGRHTSNSSLSYHSILADGIANYNTDCQVGMALASSKQA